MSDESDRRKRPAKATARQRTDERKPSEPVIEPANQSASIPRKSGSSAIVIGLLVVLGGATAFGAAWGLGLFSSDDDNSAGTETTVADTGNRGESDTTQSSESSGAESQPNENKTRPDEKPRTETSTDPEDPLAKLREQINQRNPETADPVKPDTGKPGEAPVKPPAVVVSERPYELLEVEPFDRTVAVTAELHDRVQSEIGKLRNARKTLATALDQLVVTLATEGKIEEIQKLRLAKEQVERTGDSSGLDGLTAEPIVEAKQAYAASVTASNEQLAAAYDKAIERAGEANDVDLQARLTREREAEFDLTASQWTVVFRSDDPHHWNTSFSDGSDVAVDLSTVADGVRSLRLRRMDSGATVVIPMTKALLTGDDVDEARHIGWVGSNRDRNSRKLGVYRTDEELPRDATNAIVLTGRFGRRYAGWGFGHTQSRADLPQGFTWNGQSIGPTVFEIAVSISPVEAVTPFSLRVDAPGNPQLTPVELPTDDPILVELESAKQSHAEKIAFARNKVLESFDVMLKELGTQGDAAGIEKLAAVRKEFADGDTVEEPSTKLRMKLNSFYGEIDRADDDLQKAYGRAASSFERSDRADVAGLLQDEIEKGVGYEADRWVVLFRSPDPNLWNTQSRGKFRFARPTSDAPAGTEFLRMQVIPIRGSAAKKLDPVICRMTRERLTIQSDVDRIGWNGQKKLNNAGVHLGIYLLDKEIKFPAPNQARGLVSIWSRGFDSHLGWGFGHHIKIGKTQA